MPEYETMWGEVTRRTDEREHYHDRWERAVQRRLELGVYVPCRRVDGSYLTPTIAKGSGIVGSPGEGRITIDFEGNLFGSSNMRSWAERVHHAAGRHVSVYPTVARQSVDDAWVRRIGTYEVDSDRISLADDAEEPLRDWLGDEEYEHAVSNLLHGKIYTEAAFRRLADEAERGYDVSKLINRKSRRG